MTYGKPVDGKYKIPPGTAPKSCKGCGASIFWIRTQAGKAMPLDPDGTPHWATCRNAVDFKQKKGEERGK